MFRTILSCFLWKEFKCLIADLVSPQVSLLYSSTDFTIELYNFNLFSKLIYIPLTHILLTFADVLVARFFLFVISSSLPKSDPNFLTFLHNSLFLSLRYIFVCSVLSSFTFKLSSLRIGPTMFVILLSRNSYIFIKSASTG